MNSKEKEIGNLQCIDFHPDQKSVTLNLTDVGSIKSSQLCFELDLKPAYTQI